VENRVSEIQSLTTVENWRHIASKENPADSLSRGVMPGILSHLDSWWHGPNWLKKADSEWPVTLVDHSLNVPDKREAPKTFSSHVATSDSELDIFERYSDYERYQGEGLCIRLLHVTFEKVFSRVTTLSLIHCRADDCYLPLLLSFCTSESAVYDFVVLLPFLTTTIL